MECMAQEPVLFEDILCQIVDMIGAEVGLYCLLFYCFVFSSSDSLVFQCTRYPLEISFKDDF